jgi:adenosylcobyric acid synthase
MRAHCVMVLGTTSGAGKSWLATALCRWYARQGLKVAPFKAQNMSNHARVVAAASGVGEIGSAQYFQALAAHAVPEVRMNPVLLKPETNSGSQVILLGQVNTTLTQPPWRERSEMLWPFITESLDALRAENDVVVIEGAGSPAEINLMDRDIVNLRVACHANARCLLITDIDRGGAFAHLYGTWALLAKADQARIHGFVLNKFRGEVSLLSPAPERLFTLTGIPTVGTLPFWREHGLPEEDGLFDDHVQPNVPITRTIAIIAYPYASNLDEFESLKKIPGLRLVWVRHPNQLPELNRDDWLVLPGSKQTSADLAWLREHGLAHTIQTFAQQGGAVLGVCGGLQMLGQQLIDRHGVDGSAEGLGLLSVVTEFSPTKTVRHREVTTGMIAGPWAALSNLKCQGYEIHQGHTHAISSNECLRSDARELIKDLMWQDASGRVLGIYLHGMFENPQVLAALFGAQVPSLHTVFEGLADCLGRNIDHAFLEQLIA